MTNKNNADIMNTLKTALGQAPAPGAELIEVQTAVGPRKALAIPASTFFYYVQNERFTGYAGNIVIDTETITNAVQADACLLIGVRPRALCETQDGHVTTTKPMPEVDGVAFIDVPAKRIGGTIEPKRYEHKSLGVIIELGLTGVATREGLVAAWLSPSSVRTVAKAIVNEQAEGGLRLTVWLRLPGAEVASPEAAEAAKTESGVALEDAEATTDTDEITD